MTFSVCVLVGVFATAVQLAGGCGGVSPNGFGGFASGDNRSSGAASESDATTSGRDGDSSSRAADDGGSGARNGSGSGSFDFAEAGICHAGCLCLPVDACGAGCYPSQLPEDDGAVVETACSNAIVQCNASGTAWSTGTPINNCLFGTMVYIDAGPDGAFCCTGPERETDAGDASADNGASDAALDGGPADASGE
jgi:hypothetical protein